MASDLTAADVVRAWREPNLYTAMAVASTLHEWHKGATDRFIQGVRFGIEDYLDISHQLSQEESQEFTKGYALGAEARRMMEGGDG